MDCIIVKKRILYEYNDELCGNRAFLLKVLFGGTVAGILVIKRVARFPRVVHTTYECWLYTELHLNLTSNESAHFIAILTDTKHSSKR